MSMRKIKMDLGQSITHQVGETYRSLRSCWVKAPTSTHKVESTATRCRRHHWEATRGSSTCYSAGTPTSTRKVDTSATRYRRHHTEVTRRSSTCYSTGAPTSVRKVD